MNATRHPFPLRALAALLLAAMLLAMHVTAQEPSAAPARVLRIGHLRGGAEGSPTTAALEALRRALSADAESSKALAEAGYGAVGLFACDGAEDMLRRLDAREFDVAFATTGVFAEQRAGYVAIVQSRRPGDTFAPRGDRVLRHGALIASARSPLFAARKPTGEDIAEALRRTPLAVVSTRSVAGYVSPMYRLRREYGIAAPEGGLLWFDSSEEVVMAVTSGLADVGACEAGAVERVLSALPEGIVRRDLVRSVFETEPSPTDPVVVRAELAPERSPLGRAIKAAIREASQAGRFGELQYLPADSEQYARVAQLLAEFRRTEPEAPR